jgi:hypothetical protein
MLVNLKIFGYLFVLHVVHIYEILGVWGSSNHSSFPVTLANAQFIIIIISTIIIINLLVLLLLSGHSFVNDILFGLMQALDTPVTLHGSAYFVILLDGLARGVYTIYSNTSTDICIL